MDVVDDVSARVLHVVLDDRVNRGPLDLAAPRHGMNFGRRAELLVHDGRPLPAESGRSNRQRRRNDHQGRERMLDLERLLLTSFRSSTAQGATCTCTEPLLTSAPIDVRNAVSVGKTCANVST